VEKAMSPKGMRGKLPPGFAVKSRTTVIIYLMENYLQSLRLSVPYYITMMTGIQPVFLLVFNSLEVYL